MADYEKWLGMARIAFATANRELNKSFVNEDERDLDMMANRFYYSAYYAVTAALVRRGVTLPVVNDVVRNAWSHTDTPEIFAEQLAAYRVGRDTRNDVARRLRELYALRTNADYVPDERATKAQMATARRDTGYIIKVVEEILEAGR